MAGPRTSPEKKPPERGASAKTAVLTKALTRVAVRWGLGARELAGILGVSQATTYRILDGSRSVDLAQKEGELALLCVRIYRSLDALVGGDDVKARTWLGAVNRHLGASPLAMMGRVSGIVQVADYLDAMRGKV